MLRENVWTTKTRTRGRRKVLVLIVFMIITVAVLRRLAATKYTNKPAKVERFLRDWCRIRKTRVDWEGILSPCEGRNGWGSNGWEAEQQTDPETSYISMWDIRPAGEFSKFSLQSRTAKGNFKRIGGDTWRVNINGPSSVAGTLFDHANGTYEVVFLVTVQGVYNVDVVLEHSLCDGFTDPPPNWFKTGNSQGKNQKEGILGKESRRSYLLKKLWSGNPITITIPPPGSEGQVLTAVMDAYKSQQFDLNCGLQCNHLWDGFGNWVVTGNTMLWKPFVPDDDKPRSWSEDRVRKTSVLWMYGDSVSNQFYSGIRQHPLCSRVFRWCGHTYNWVYKLQGNLSVAKSQDDSLDFDGDRAVNELDDVISQSIFDVNSVILVNAGLHYLESSNFANYRKLVDGFIRLLKRERFDGLLGKDVSTFPGQVIWKTTTSLHKEKLDGKHLQARRFLTSQRVLLFNAYATQAMCRAGFRVLDVFPLTDSYPHGTGNPVRTKDAVHYQHFVFETVERLLEDYFVKTTIKQ